MGTIQGEFYQKNVNNNYCGGVARAENTVKDGVSQLT